MFWNAYDANKVTQAQRPFAFIDFDATIEKNRRKCNKKQLDIDAALVKEIEAELERHPAQVISDKALRVELGRKEGQSRFRTKKFQVHNLIWKFKLKGVGRDRPSACT